MSEKEGLMPLTNESEQGNDKKIEHEAELIAYNIQEITRCSDRAATDLKDTLIEFALEIKRQAIEP